LLIGVWRSSPERAVDRQEVQQNPDVFLVTKIWHISLELNQTFDLQRCSEGRFGVRGERKLFNFGSDKVGLRRASPTQTQEHSSASPSERVVTRCGGYRFSCFLITMAIHELPIIQFTFATFYVHDDHGKSSREK
jgi:hypothetical protein